MGLNLNHCTPLNSYVCWIHFGSEIVLKIFARIEIGWSEIRMALDILHGHHLKAFRFDILIIQLECDNVGAVIQCAQCVSISRYFVQKRKHRFKYSFISFPDTDCTTNTHFSKKYYVRISWITMWWWLVAVEYGISAFNEFQRSQYCKMIVPQ